MTSAIMKPGHEGYRERSHKPFTVLCAFLKIGVDNSGRLGGLRIVLATATSAFCRFCIGAPCILSGQSKPSLHQALL